MSSTAIPLHRWQFFRAGGFDQVKLETGADLMHLDQLDQKLWVALACPTTGLEFDTKTLALVDTDKDGRIRAPDIIAAARWLTSLLKDPNDAVKGSAMLPLSAINVSVPEGGQLLASVKQILVHLGKPDAQGITVEDAADTARVFAQTKLNGDGIVPAEAASDPATKQAIEEMIACLGAEMDRSGKPGLSQPMLDRFFAEAKAYSDWWSAAETNAGILPLGERTSAAAAAIDAVKAKVEDYFTRCRLVAFDPRAVGALNREEKEYLVFTARDLTLASVEIAAFPLARVEAQKPLPLKEGINPAWAAAMETLRTAATEPLLGSKTSLTEFDWAGLAGKLVAYRNWLLLKPASPVETLGLKRLRALLSGPAQQQITALIAEDWKLEPEFASIVAVDKLVRYHRDLYKLCNNFVAFRDFYSRLDKAIFQAGTLYLDQRSCDLCLIVDDSGKHALMASLAGTYLAYCDCTRKGTGEKMQILAAFTGGDSDNLMVGRNGVFYDRKGRDWDATITKIVDNPISIRQAFWSPYKKVARLIQEQVAKRAAAADATSVSRMERAAAKAGETSVSGTPPADPPKPKIDPGLIAALSVGAAGVGGMIGGILSSFLGLKAWMPLGVVAIILVISGPSMILAWLKLRRRNLGPILDANGWAVNAKARINVPFGASLTRVAALPKGAKRDLADPFADKKNPWPAIIVTVVVLGVALWILNDWGLMHKWTGVGKDRSTNSVPALNTNAPVTTTTVSTNK